ncbi:hypothetical protein LEN26_021048 [Aphanomyces euteiches]|nr:hypothetical protein LEN26_021048 [Aphanomyces euteiches]KAH9105186.1 hypothetical protein AeMF1_018920 [Aphanomyces euteiches]KAH9182624.1 hypothetical protein AeNC1_015400 [Aphanomyces euteiches]
MNVATTRKRGLDDNKMLFDSIRRASPSQAHIVHDIISKRIAIDGKQPQPNSQEALDLLKSQELFLSVVLDWQKHEHSDTSSVHGGDTSSQPTYASSVESSEPSDHEGGAATRLINFTRSSKQSKLKSEDPSPTNAPKIHTLPQPQPLPNLNLNNLLPAPTKRIGIYTPRSRQDLLQKYMEKRSKRLSRKKVRYRVRKTLANARPRVKGRFVKTEQPLTAAAVEEMEKKQTKMMVVASGFDYAQASYDCERNTKTEVAEVISSITITKKRRGEEIDWEEWSVRLDQSILSLLPSQYVDSPFPEVFSELANLVGDAEEECSPEAYSKALHSGAVYVALCLSHYMSLRHPSLWEHDDELSPILKHYLSDIKILWSRRKTKTGQMFDFIQGAVSGIAAVIWLGYDDGKRFLSSLFP